MNSDQWLGTRYPWIESLNGDCLCVDCRSLCLLTRLRLDHPGACPSSAWDAHVWAQPYLLAQSREVGTQCIIPARHEADVDIPLCSFDIYFKAETTSQLGACGIGRVGRCTFQRAPCFPLA